LFVFFKFELPNDESVNLTNTRSIIIIGCLLELLSVYSEKMVRKIHT